MTGTGTTMTGTRRRTRRSRHPLIAALLAPLLVLPALAITSVSGSVPAGAASPVAGQVTRGGDTHRTNWYPNQARLSESNVKDPSFGELFSTALDGQIYAQPIVANGVLVVVTESNHVYGLNPETGAILWQRAFGSAYDARTIGCGDLVPTVGITSTPVVDTTTGTVYIVNDQYVSGTSGPDEFVMHALNVQTGTDRAGFPTVLQGTADNRAVTFDASHQSQRPGLLLLGGVVYAAFSAHCQVPAWTGWVMGVSATSGAITARWADHSQNTTNPGGGIWMSGGGLASDGAGQIVLAIGNAFVPNPGTYTKANPPAEMSNAVARLSVGSNGKLTLTDFFRPSSELFLDQNDLDLGSGGVALLPEAYFGTPSHPHLAVAGGKEGYVYLLDRDNLGGQADTGGTDNVLGRYGPNGGIWSQPSVWPGDGGYVYVPTAGPGSISYGQGQSGHLNAYKYVDNGTTPALSLAATSSTPWGFGSSNVVVTSSGTTSGSALLWAVTSQSAGNGLGVPNASLVAYRAVPSGADFTVVRSFPIGTTTKFTPPGVGPNGRLYVGTYDGHILGFGAPLGTLLSTSAVGFADTTPGSSSTQTATFVASGTATVTGMSTTGPFTDGAPKVNGTAATYPVALGSGDVLTVPVTFRPTVAGTVSGTVSAQISGHADVTADLTGKGVATAAQLVVSTGALNLGTITVGGTPATNTVTFTNTGQQSLTITSVGGPASPFSAKGLPPATTVLAGGASVAVTVSFTPAAVGSFTGSLSLGWSGGTETVSLAASASNSGLLTRSPKAVSFGAVGLGTSKTLEFALTNSGGSPLSISVSKAPTRGDFHALDAVGEGTALAPGASITVRVAFSPTRVGDQNDVWSLTATDGQGVRSVQFTGTGTGALANATRPTVMGRVRVGHTIAALPGTWSVTPSTAPGSTTLSYQWLRDGAAIRNATASTYRLVPADAGKRVSVLVAARRTGLASVRAASAAVLVGLGSPPVPRVAPSISGTIRVGQTLVGRSGVWAPAGGTVRWQWLKDGVPVTRAVWSRISLGSGWRGHRISLRVTVVLAGYLPGTFTTTSVRVR